jgi:copper homeostasis protein
MALVEICSGSLNSAIAAFRGGAGRIELCDNLYEGGTTPSYGCLKKASEIIRIPINVLIRPRGGDFCYNANEFGVMKDDILLCKDLGMNGVVIGILKENGDIDLDRIAELTELARPLSVTFHRAFDMVPDPYYAMDKIISLGIDRILTSGQKESAVLGRELIKKLMEMAGRKVIILPGGGLNVGNIKEFDEYLNAPEYHATCRSAVKSPMKFRNPEVTMGGLHQIPEYEILETDPEKVRIFVSKVN